MDDRTLSPFQQGILFRNHVRLGPAGKRPMVFAHGFGCDQNMWRYVAPAFEQDYTTVLFDYVGSGRSDLSAFSPARYGSLEGYAQDLLEIADVLDLTDAVLVGHSVSAMIGLLAAVRQPSRFSTLVMIGPSPHYLNDPPAYFGGLDAGDIEALLSMMDHNYMGWAGHLGPMVMGNPDRPELGEELERSFCSTDPMAAKVFARATFYADNRADLERLTVPSLILQVSDDPIAPMSVGRYMHAHMPASTLDIIQAAGHCPHVSHPEETIRAMKAYLDPRRASL